MSVNRTLSSSHAPSAVSALSNPRALLLLCVCSVVAFLLGWSAAHPDTSTHADYLTHDITSTPKTGFNPDTERIQKRLDTLETILERLEDKQHSPSHNPQIHGGIPSNTRAITIPTLNAQQIEKQIKLEAKDYSSVDFSHLTFWSTDFHITPIADLKFLFKQFNITVIDKSLSGACGRTRTCATDLKVLNGGNGYYLGDHPEKLTQQLFEAYKDDPQFSQVDGILCFHPIATCQLYMPFNKSLLMISSTRYEHGQSAPTEWQRFNKILIHAAKNPRHLVAGNSVYDADYIRYFTNIDAAYIPSFCGQITARYAWTQKSRHKEFLLGHMHVSKSANEFWDGGSLVWQVLIDGVEEARQKSTQPGAKTLVVKPLNAIYGHYEYQDLANHPAIIHMPYQVSVMSMFEQYRMNIPLFYPSLSFLVQLQQQYGVLSERTWARVYGRGQVGGSDVPAHPAIWWPDPNNDKDTQALQFWLAKSDFYVKPHIQYYDSWDDLVDKLLTTDFHAVSAAMAVENEIVERRLKRQWKGILARMFRDRPKTGYAMPENFEAGMREGWAMDYRLANPELVQGT